MSVEDLGQPLSHRRRTSIASPKDIQSITDDEASEDEAGAPATPPQKQQAPPHLRSIASGVVLDEAPHGTAVSMMQLLAGTDDAVRAAAAELLDRLPSAHLEPHESDIQELLSHPTSAVRRAALRLLRSLQPNQLAPHVATVVRLIGDVDAAVRSEAAQILQMVERSLPKTLHKNKHTYAELLTHQDSTVQCTALIALGTLQPDELVRHQAAIDHQLKRVPPCASAVLCTALQALGVWSWTPSDHFPSAHLPPVNGSVGDLLVAPMKGSAVRCGALRCGAMRCGAMRCGAVRCGAVLCGVVWCGSAD